MLLLVQILQQFKYFFAFCPSRCFVCYIDSSVLYIVIFSRMHKPVLEILHYLQIIAFIELHINDTSYTELYDFWPSDAESRNNEVRCSYSLYILFKVLLTSVSCFAATYAK